MRAGSLTAFPIVTLTARDLDLANADSPAKADLIYRFRYSDLIARDDSTVGLQLRGDDLQPREILTNEQRGQPRGDAKKRCLCLNVIIVGKTPGGELGSKYAGGKWKSERTFLDLLDHALQYLLDCVDEYCIHLLERDVSADVWKKAFIKDLDGKSNGIVGRTVRDGFVAAVKNVPPTLPSDPCFWLFFNRLVDSEKLPSNPGTTVISMPQVPGQNVYRPTPSTKTPSEDYSFFGDKAQDFQIAHEIVHQAGVTHSKDNLIPSDGKGNPDPNKATPGNDRDKTDLMHPVSQKGAKLADADCAKLREATAKHKCCEDAPTVDEFFAK